MQLTRRVLIRSTKPSSTIRRFIDISNYGTKFLVVQSLWRSGLTVLQVFINHPIALKYDEGFFAAMLKGLLVLGDQVRPSPDKIEEDVGHLGYLREQGLEHGDVSGALTPDLEALHGGSCAFEPCQDLFKCSPLDAFDFRSVFLFDGPSRSHR